MTRSAALRYALAAACIALAALLHLSPAGPFLHPTGLFVFAVIAAAWFGGAGPGLLAAVLATFALPQLIPMSYPLVAGVFDLPRFITFAVTGFAVGWGATRRRRAETALREVRSELEAKVTERTRAVQTSEERYALAMQASGEGHWDWKIATDEFYASPRWREISGLAPDEKLGTRAQMLARYPFHPEDRPKYEAAVAAHFAGATPRVDMEVRITPHGTLRWVKFTGMCLRDAAGAPVRWAGSIMDITEQKRAQEALRESEQRYERAMEATEAGHWEWDLVGQQVFHSPRFRELYGASPEEKFADRDAWKARQPVSRAERERQEQALQAAIADPTKSYDIELSFEVRPGEIRWLRSRGKVFRTEDGRPLRVTGATTDITARKLAEEALRESEERYSLAMEASNEGHFDTNLVTGELFVSERLNEIYEFAPGTRFASRNDYLKHFRFYANDGEVYLAALKAAEAEGAPECYEFEYRIVRPSGEVRWLRTRGKVTRDADGRAVRRTGVVTDITERKRAEQALRESEQRYERAMEGSDAGHWDWNIVSDEMFVSARAREMLALPAGALPARRSEIMALVPMHPDDRAGMEDKVVAGIAAGTYERDYRVIPRAGEVRWLRARAKVFKDARGAALRMTGSLTDITERKLAADELGESEARFRGLTELSSDWYWRQDENLRFTYMSDQAAALGGFSPEASIGNLRWELPGITPLSSSWAEHRAVLAARQPFRDLELSRQLPDGSLTYYTISGAPIFDEQGRFKGYQGIGRSMTERKRMEAELRQSEARFRALTELSSDWYWRQDENLRFTFVSHQVADTTAYPREWVIGKTRAELPGITLLSSSWAEHQALLAAGQPFRDLEYARVGRDGRKEYVSVSGAPIFDEQGVFRGYHGIGRNITERKRIEEELRSRQEMLDLAQRSAQVVAFEWRIGADGRDRNPWSAEIAAMYGVAPEVYDGSFERWKSFIHPEDWPAVKEALRHAQRTGEVDTEYRVVHPDGSVHWLQSKGRMYFDAENKPARMLGFMHDVTERRQAEEELKRLERQLRQAQRLEAMGTLAGGIAHDFNNILGAILGYGEMALRDAAKGSRLRRDLDSILTAGERGRALVDRVLAFSRSGIGERVAVHVEKVVREALDLLSAKLPPNVTLHAKLHAGPAALLGDATQVHQVLMNLATNAIQAMPSGGTLRVSLDALRTEAARVPTIGTLAPGEYLVLQVADTGTGIAPGIVDKIFDPFFTTKEVGTGTGLGLSLVHGIVSELGGAIDVASTLGAGSKFTVYLPRSGDAPDALEKQEPELPRGDGQRVLVVDDEEPLVRLATRTLEELGYAPTGFTSSSAALAAFRADPQRFDALITDERMPGMSGSALIREVRGIRDRMPIVLMSGYVGGAVASRAREAGAEEVLKKPLSARDLAASLARVLHP